jgi:hypothetical protein
MSLLVEYILPISALLRVVTDCMSSRTSEHDMQLDRDNGPYICQLNPCRSSLCSLVCSKLQYVEKDRNARHRQVDFRQ